MLFMCDSDAHCHAHALVVDSGNVGMQHDRQITPNRSCPALLSVAMFELHKNSCYCKVVWATRHISKAFYKRLVVL
jgi:hypothetical protein